MFKTMLAAAGGEESKTPAAKPQVSKLNPQPLASKPLPKPDESNTAKKARTFTEAKGIHISAVPPAKPPRNNSNTKHTSSGPAKSTPSRAPMKQRAKSPAKPQAKSMPGKATSLKTVYVEPEQKRTKKMNFMEIMNKAKEVDGDKLKLDMKTKPREKLVKDRRKPDPKADHKPMTSSQQHKPTSRKPSPKQSSKPPAPRVPLGPAPTARPSAELEARIRQKRKWEQDDVDSELEDFIVDDEDEESTQGYSAQILEAMGLKPRARYYDDDSSDGMEATGVDLFEEEARSARLARREDIEEERKLAALAEAKALRKKKRTA